MKHFLTSSKVAAPLNPGSCLPVIHHTPHTV
jgi:hypothetical protein